MYKYTYLSANIRIIMQLSKKKYINLQKIYKIYG